MQPWLPDCSVQSVREALRVVMPEIADGPIEIRHRPAGEAERWRRTIARVGDHIVKFAWAEEACPWIEREIVVHTALQELAPALPLPPLVRTSPEPLILIRRFVEGVPAAWGAEATALPPERRMAMACEMARALAAFHDPHVRESMSSGVSLNEPDVQTSTDDARGRFDMLVRPENYDLVKRMCDWVDPILAQTVEPVLLHGDFHGFNLVFDPAWQTLHAVLDLEAVGIGDFHLDFRYLPRTDPSLGLLFDILASYETASGRSVSLERVMAWHVRTSLGDTLWRTEAGIEIPGGGDADANVLLLGNTLDVARIHV